MTFNDGELKIELVELHPKGGQYAGSRPMGIRVTHIETGLVAEVSGYRSQKRMRDIAIDMILGGLTSPHNR